MRAVSIMNSTEKSLGERMKDFHSINQVGKNKNRKRIKYPPR